MLRLAQCYLQLHWFYYDISADRLIKSKQAIDAAFRIDPDLPEAHLAIGTYYYMGFLNYQRLEEITDSTERLSNNSECLYTKG